MLTMRPIANIVGGGVCCATNTKSGRADDQDAMKKGKPESLPLGEFDAKAELGLAIESVVARSPTVKFFERFI